VGEVFAAAVADNEPSPCPVAGASCNHEALLLAFHAHSREASTWTLACV
jgi:hypothetical protein